jgi:hypothetical protein
MTPPTPFPVVIGRTKKGFYFRWRTNSKILKISLNFRGGKSHNITESRSFLHRNKTTNFVNIMQSRISKHPVLAQLGSCLVLKDMGKSERAKGQESLHTAGGPSGY